MCLGASLLIAVISLPLWQTVTRQVRLLAGAWDPVRSGAAAQEISRQYRSNLYLLAPRDALWMAGTGRLSIAEIEQLSEQDSDNDLYRYLRILLRLREVSAATQPAQVDADLIRLMNFRAKNRTARLHLASWQAMVRKTALSSGLSMRVSAVLAINETNKSYNEPALHELAGRLLDAGDRWREAGQLDEAVLAHRSMVELMTDLVNDSPTPRVALLAAQHLPAALSSLSEDLAALAGMRQDDGLQVWGAACADQAARADDFTERWHATATDSRTNLLPTLAEGILAPVEQDRVLGSMSAQMLAGFIWLIGFVITVDVLIMGAVFGKGTPNVTSSGRNVWFAAVVPAGMLVWVLWWLTRADIEFEWLLSLPTLPLAGGVPAWLPIWLPGIVFMIAVVLVVFWIISDLCLGPGVTGRFRPLPKAGTHSGERDGSTDAVQRQPVDGKGLSSVSRWSLASAVVVLLTFLGVLWFWPIDSEAWRPPVNIQRLRMLWLVIGLEAAVIAVGGLMILARARREGLDRLGSRCRLLSQVAARTLLLVSLIGLACCVMNLRNDRLHSEAFWNAALDPVADHLREANWKVAYFDGAEAIVDGLDRR